MARVFIGCDEPTIQALLVYLCQDEGHQVIGIVPTVETTLQVLRTTPHPVIAILEWDHSAPRPQYPLFPTIRKHPKWYGRHRYITINWSTISDDEQAILKKLDVIVLRGPFSADALLGAVAKSAALLPE